MIFRILPSLLIGLSLLASPSGANAQASRDYGVVRAGTLQLDEAHTSVLAFVSHLGRSYTVFRFSDIQGSLIWDPGAPQASRLEVSVRTESVQTPVEGFAERLLGDRFLRSSQFPAATFVSREFRQVSATGGQVAGDLTLMGVVRPVVFEVELIGADAAAIGFRARTSIAASDYDLPSYITGSIQILVDAEFIEPPSQDQ